MKTLIRVDNANCTDCLNVIQDVLLARSLVRSVRLHTADGCIEVEHDHDEPDALVELLGRSLRGWQIADNGEIMQTPSVPAVAHVCHLRDARSRPDPLHQPHATDLGGESPCFAHVFDSDPDKPAKTGDH